MTAIRILWSAFRNIFADFGQTVRIFALPALLLAFILGAAIWAMMQYPRVHEGVVIVPAALAAVVAVLWPTINFHRHVLTGERFGWIPRIHWRAVFGYGVMTIPLGLVVLGLNFLAALVASKAMSAIPDSIPPAAQVILIALFLGTFSTAIGLRLFSLLPGLAIGATMAGYSPTARGSLVTILLVALAINIVLIGYTLLQIALMPYMAEVFASGFSVAMFVIQSLLNAISTVFGISLLTALYAQYVRRPA